jgi:hypothetical protein
MIEFITKSRAQELIELVEIYYHLNMTLKISPRCRLPAKWTSTMWRLSVYWPPIAAHACDKIISRRSQSDVSERLTMMERPGDIEPPWLRLTE